MMIVTSSSRGISGMSSVIPHEEGVRGLDLEPALFGMGVPQNHDNPHQQFCGRGGLEAEGLPCNLDDNADNWSTSFTILDEWQMQYRSTASFRMCTWCLHQRPRFTSDPEFRCGRRPRGLCPLEYGVGAWSEYKTIQSLRCSDWSRRGGVPSAP